MATSFVNDDLKKVQIFSKQKNKNDSQTMQHVRNFLTVSKNFWSYQTDAITTPGEPLLCLFDTIEEVFTHKTKHKNIYISYSSTYISSYLLFTTKKIFYNTWSFQK